jgi:hypothetical protein
MPGHDNNDQTQGQVSCEQEQDSWNRNQAGQDKGDKTDRTGQIGQGNLDQTARTGELVQNRKDKSGHDSNTRTAASVQLGCKSQGRTAGTGQREMTVRTIHPGQETENNTVVTGQKAQDS